MMDEAKAMQEALCVFTQCYRAMEPFVIRMEDILKEWKCIEEFELEERLTLDDNLWLIP